MGDGRDNGRGGPRDGHDGSAFRQCASSEVYGTFQRYLGLADHGVKTPSVRFDRDCQITGWSKSIVFLILTASRRARDEMRLSSQAAVCSDNACLVGFRHVT